MNNTDKEFIEWLDAKISERVVRLDQETNPVLHRRQYSKWLELQVIKEKFKQLKDNDND